MTMEAATTPFMTTEEIAERFRTKPQTVRYWSTIGYGPRSIRVGRRRLHPLEAVTEFERDPKPQTVRYLSTIGYGPRSIKVGRRRLYPLEAVTEFERDLLAGGTPVSA